jgi:hypothetical protein
MSPTLLGDLNLSASKGIVLDVTHTEVRVPLGVALLLLTWIGVIFV